MPNQKHSSRQLQYLEAMGINLWVSRDFQETDIVADVIESKIDIEPELLLEEPESSVDLPQIMTEQSTDQPKNTLDQLRQEVSVCQKCQLHSERTQTVFGVGNSQSNILFIGEAPGHDEDKQGEPFVGRAGQLLNSMLFAIGLRREQIFIANILKCRPPNNRNPLVGEIEQCIPYLKQQIELVNPKVIVVVGRVAAHALLNTELPMAKLRGQQHYLPETQLPIIVTYHPAYLLRSPLAKQKSWEDLLMLYELDKNLFQSK
ncbi:MAG: uracil-DNA glycosylase [Methylococcales bacterium]|nr:uracil-DNA glycosylase [Methylococcales bacterium]MBT7408250.1 uracil-DNA glycosylase [Methylococcales bacterium]